MGSRWVTRTHWYSWLSKWACDAMLEWGLDCLSHSSAVSKLLHLLSNSSNDYFKEAKPQPLSLCFLGNLAKVLDYHRPPRPYSIVLHQGYPGGWEPKLGWPLWTLSFWETFLTLVATADSPSALPNPLPHTLYNTCSSVSKLKAVRRNNYKDGKETTHTHTALLQSGIHSQIVYEEDSPLVTWNDSCSRRKDKL